MQDDLFGYDVILCVVNVQDQHWTLLVSIIPIEEWSYCNGLTTFLNSQVMDQRNSVLVLLDPLSGVPDTSVITQFK